MRDDIRQDSTDQVADQGTSEAEISDEQRAAAERRSVEKAQGATGTVAPGGDDIIIK